MKKHYHELGQESLGMSDIAMLTLNGCGTVAPLKFGGDGKYKAYIGDFDEVDLHSMEHYDRVFSCENWLKIYDDDSLVLDITADEIRVYRCGGYGCIILTKGRV